MYMALTLNNIHVLLLTVVGLLWFSWWGGSKSQHHLEIQMYL